jgi:hypothetical protein
MAHILLRLCTCLALCGVLLAGGSIVVEDGKTVCQKDDGQDVTATWSGPSGAVEWTWSVSGEGASLIPGADVGPTVNIRLASSLTPGTHTFTVSCSVRYRKSDGTYVDGDPNPTDVEGTWKIVHIVPAMANPERVGYTAMGHDRTKHLTASAQPPEEAPNFTASAKDGKITVVMTNGSANPIRFDVVGVSPSTAAGDTAVVFTHSEAGKCEEAPVTVIVPKKIGTPHPQFGPAPVVPTNALLNSATIPAAWDTAPPDVDRSINCVTVLTVTVLDQFDARCGDLYAGAFITEDGGRDINVTLSAGSDYPDSVGVLFVDQNGPYAPTDPAVVNWLTQPVPAVQSSTQNTSRDVEVDGFSIGNTGTRTAIFTAPNILEIRWP